MDDKFLQEINNIDSSFNLELVGIQQEMSLNILLDESNRFNNTIKGIDESVILEISIGDIFKKIGEFFKRIINGIREFLAKIFNMLGNAFKSLALKLIPEDKLNELEKAIDNNVKNESAIIQEAASNPENTFKIYLKILFKLHKSGLAGFSTKARWQSGILNTIDGMFISSMNNLNKEINDIVKAILSGKDEYRGKSFTDIKNNMDEFIKHYCLASGYDKLFKGDKYNVIVDDYEWGKEVDMTNILKFKDEIMEIAFHKSEIISRQKEYYKNYEKMMKDVENEIKRQCKDTNNTQYINLSLSFVSSFVKAANNLTKNSIAAYKQAYKNAMRIVLDINKYMVSKCKEYKIDIDLDYYRNMANE